MSTSVKPEKGTSPQPETPTQQEERIEGGLDEALEDSFPASDPVGVTPDAVSHDGEEDALDEALDESFPASDPPSPVQPGEK